MTKNKDCTKYWSERQENYVAKKVSGYVQPASGAGKFKKSDVNANDFLIECKTAETAKSQFTIKKDWFEKLKGEALMNHKSMRALAFNFGEEAEHNYFILDENSFVLMKDAFEKMHSEED